MRRNKVINGIIGLAFIVMFINVIPVAEQVKGETTSMVELGMWDGRPVFPGTPEHYITFENGSTEPLRFRQYETSNPIQYEVINYTSDNNILYIYNETNDGGPVATQRSEMFLYGDSFKSLEFDCYILQNDSFSMYTQLMYYYFGAHTSGSSALYNNATNTVTGHNVGIVQFPNATIKLRMRNGSSDIEYFFNVSRGDVIHFAFGRYWTVQEGLIEYVYMIHDDSSYLFYMQDEEIVSEPTYIDYEPSFYLETFIDDGDHIKIGFDDFKFYNETWTIDEIQGYTRSPFKGLEAMMPVIVVMGIIPVVIGLVRRF